MIQSEIVRLVKLVNAAYPNAKPVPPDALPVWVEDLGDLHEAHVRAAFTAYRRSGHEFPPTCAELRRLALEMAEPTPRFEAAWQAIWAAIGRHGRYREDQAVGDLKAVPLAHELVTAMGGWDCICNGGPDEAKPTDPGVWRSQAEHAFKGLAEERKTDLAVARLNPALPRVAAAKERLKQAGTTETPGVSPAMTSVAEVMAIKRNGHEMLRLSAAGGTR